MMTHLVSFGTRLYFAFEYNLYQSSKYENFTDLVTEKELDNLNKKIVSTVFAL